MKPNGEADRDLLFCFTADPEWASYKLGVFVCLNCSGVHRSLSSRVKSIKLDYWEDELVEVEGHFNVHVIVINTLPICLYLSHLRSSWKPKAMPAHEPFLRKQFRCTTIGLRRTTAGECLSQLFLANIVMVKSSAITCADCWHWIKTKQKPHTEVQVM